MGLIGISLVVASIVCFCIYPRVWLDLAAPLLQWRRRPPISPEREKEDAAVSGSISASVSESRLETTGPASPKAVSGRAIPPPPLPLSRSRSRSADEDEEDEPTTPKATQTTQTSQTSQITTTTPLLSLSMPDDDSSPRSMPPPMFPALSSAQRAAGPSQGLMAPPPRISPRISPSSSLSAQRRPPGLAPARTSSSLAPLAPLASLASPLTSPSSSRNKVHLTPGHSPLDWARLTADPHANLRNMPPEAPQLLRVTPSLLRTMNGRRGRDAWTALGGMVYNLSPYLPFHPGGEPELLRCAGRDGSRLFNDIHSWVNYDNMLSACRIGILVEEHESVASPMEDMD